MKCIKLILLTLTMSFFVLLVGCNVENSERTHNGIINNIAIPKELEKEEIKNEEIINVKTVEYEVKKADWIKIEGVILVDTYEAYLENDAYFNNHQSSLYDEEYFKTKGIIIYGTLETSGSIGVSITSLELGENNHLTINVTKSIPEAGTCDMRYHGFIIEYQKIDEPIVNVTVTNIIKRQMVKEIILKDEASKQEMIGFINNNNKVSRVFVVFWFKDETNLDKLSTEEKKAYYTKVNKEKVSLYQIDQLDGRMYVSMYSPIVEVTFNVFNDTELAKLYEVALIENMGTLYVNLTYEVTTTSNQER